MAFSIRFLDVPDEFLDDDLTVASAIGEIRIGDFVEEFVSCLYVWSREDYVQQWNSALSAILSGQSKAAFVTEYTGADSGRLECWPIYLLDDEIHLQNHLVFFEHLDHKFAIAEYARSIRDHRFRNEDGELISDWTFALEDLRQFAKTLTT